jgi:hypothetical protein
MSSDDDHFPPTPATTGWYPVSDGTDQETFWDGTAWTKRRQYRFGSPFLDLPLHRGDPPLAPAPTSSSSTPGSVPPTPTPTSMTESYLKSRSLSADPATRPMFANAPSQTTTPSPRFRTSRQRLRFIRLIYLFLFFGTFYFIFVRRSAPNPEKYLVGLWIVGILLTIFVRMASAGGRRAVRDEESDRRPGWPFRYMSRLTDGLQGERLTSFVGGMRMQPRVGPTGFNATVPMVRLSLFANGVRVGPSSSLLSMSVPTWEARFDELDVIQAIGRLTGLTTGIVFRKSQSHEWVIFWTTNRDQVFTTFEQMGLAVSREPVRLLVGREWRDSQFAEDQLRPSEPSVLGSRNTVAPPAVNSPGNSAPLVFATPHPATTANLATAAPEDRTWPGVLVGVAGIVFVISIIALIFGFSRATPNLTPGVSPAGGVVTTVATPPPVGTVNPATWRTDAGNDARYLHPSLAAIPDSIRQLRYDYGVTEDSLNLVSLTSTLESLTTYCTMMGDLATYAPVPALATDVASTGAACADLVSVDQVDLRNSDNKWTAKLASNDEHWLTILRSRLANLKDGLATSS